MSTKHKSIENEFKYYLKTVDLYSDEANSEKEKYLKYYKPKNWESKRTLYKLNYVENKNDLFRQLKSGDNEILWQIIRFLSSDPENKAHFNEYASEIIQYPGWQILTKDEKNLIIVNSKKYLFHKILKMIVGLEQELTFVLAAAGYKIVKMLLSLDEKYLDNLSTELYKKWAPIVVDYPISYGLDNGDNYEDIVKLFYEKAPKEILGLLKRRLI
ncbi:MAG: hypothetical protein H6613_16450 [Ignavibacteriales bacterium]|nr:hypothetical protein [Ignavibacteriales bacterium]